MRSVRLLVSLFFLLAAASAADIRVKVLDPQSAAVAAAQVSLLKEGTAVPIAVTPTSSEGVVIFRGVPDGRYQVQALAAGFAAQEQEVPVGRQEITVTLQLAAVPETVYVTATRGPAVGETSGASVAALTAVQLELMRPVAALDALRFLPGTVVASNGQRGALSSLFVRGGDSRYNKVIVDGVPVNEPGGTFDFGVVPLVQADRMELVRGAQSTLYGSDAMTSVVQVWTKTGTTSRPELEFGADGGNFGTASGYASLSGAHGRFDYNFFGNQFNTSGRGVNDEYSNSTQGGNVGVTLTDQLALRLRVRHFNSSTGVQGQTQFDGFPSLPPDTGESAHQNNLLGSLELSYNSSRWQHRFTGFEYNHQYADIDSFVDPGREVGGFPIDFLDHAITNINRAGFDYQGDYIERSWARTTFGYEFEDETGDVGDLEFGPPTHGLRLNHAVYGQQYLLRGRFSVIAGARFVHNETFGNKGVPRVALSYLALKGNDTFSGTRFKFSYATGIKEPRFDEAFASGNGTIPDPDLKAEENRAFETGVQQGFLGNKYSLSATYFNNLFRNQIDFFVISFSPFSGQYRNINKSIAHGAEVEFHGRPLSRLSVDATYAYTSTQILEQPAAFDSLHAPGAPLLRRPKHSGNLLVSYIARRWGANLGGSFVGRRADSDFLGLGIDHAPGYARVDVGGWYAVHPRITAYVNVENVLNNHYQEVVGYPALTANFRAGLRFRIGGE